ncbi:MAG: Uma2 family endonuclease [Gemmataceae bacterium]
MSPPIAPPTAGCSPPPFPVRRFTVDEYHRMIQAGILTENDPVELLDGWITPKMPQNVPHQLSIELVPEVLRSVLPIGWRVRAQLPITTADSEPEPDFAVVRGPILRHQLAAPTPADIGVLIEAADSTLGHDRNVKGPLYARANIGCYWIINLVDRQVEVYTDPAGPVATPHYRQRRDFRPGDVVPLVLAGQQVAAIPVNDLLPPP